MSTHLAWSRWASLGVLVCAAAVRFPGVFAGLPYIDYIDEGHVLHQSITLLNQRSFDTKWYGYPSLPAYLTVGTLIAASPFYRLLHGHGFRKDLPREREIHSTEGDHYDLISPPALIICGRLVVAALSLTTVAFAGALAKSLSGDGRTGVIAMSLAAFCPALVSRGSIVIIDTMATFFVLLALFFCERLAKEEPKGGRKRLITHESKIAGRELKKLSSARRMELYAALAGVAAGFALASKYPAGLVFVAVVTRILLLPVERKSQVSLLGLAAAGGACGVAMGAPATFLHPMAVAGNLTVISQSYNGIVSTPGYFGEAVSPGELGWPLSVLSGLGIGWMLSRKEKRESALSWMFLVVLLVGLLIEKPFQPFRNCLPLVPLSCIAAALVFGLLGQMASASRFWLGRAGVALLLCATIASLAYPSVEALGARLAERDSRVQTVDWLRSQTRPGDRVLAVAELAVLPCEWKRLGVPVHIAARSKVAELWRSGGFDYLVAEKSEPALAELPTLVARASFGAITTPDVPYFWRTNHEAITIFGCR